MGSAPNVSDKEIFDCFISSECNTSPSYYVFEQSLFNKHGFELLRWVSPDFALFRAHDELNYIHGGAAVRDFVRSCAHGLEDWLIPAYSWRTDGLTKELGQPDWLYLQLVEWARRYVDELHAKGEELSVSLLPTYAPTTEFETMLVQNGVDVCLQTVGSSGYARCLCRGTPVSVTVRYGDRCTMLHEVNVETWTAHDDVNSLYYDDDDLAEQVTNEIAVPFAELKRVTPYKKLSVAIGKKCGDQLYPRYPWFDELFAEAECSSHAIPAISELDDVTGVFSYPNIFPWNEEFVKKHGPKPKRRHKKVSRKKVGNSK